MDNIGIYYKLLPSNHIQARQPDGTVVPVALTDYNIIKVPERIYQMWYEMAQNRYDTLGQRQTAILSALQEWARDKWPEMELNSFIDLSNADVAKLQQRGVQGLEWGMYIQLRLRDMVDSIPLPDNIIKQLTNETTNIT